MKVTFVSQAGSHLASHRYRCLKPVELLNKYTDNIAATTDRKANPDSDVNIFSKHFDRSGNFLSVASAEDFGYSTVFDICDDYFDRPEGDYYRDMCERVDVIVCNTENMQTRIYEQTGKLAVIIPDPVTFPRIKPENKDYSEPKILWFGHQSNALPLLKWANECPYRITAVCDAQLNHPNIDYVKWGVGVVESMIADFNIVLIPTKLDEKSKCKSPNRALDALNAGCKVIVDNTDIYGHLHLFVNTVGVIGKDFKDCLDYTVTSLADVSCTNLSYSYIDRHHSDQIILDKWLDVFKQLGKIKDYA